MGWRKVNITKIWIFSFVELFLIIWLLNVCTQSSAIMQGFLSFIVIPALLILGIPAICHIYKKPTVPKPYRENYYKEFYTNELNGLQITKRDEYYQEFLSAAWSTAKLNPDLYKDFLVSINSHDFKVEAQGLLYNCNEKIGQLTAMMNGILPFPDAHYDVSVRQKVMAFMPQNKMMAIKTLRALTGLDFANAVNLIEVWQAGFP